MGNFVRSPSGPGQVVADTHAPQLDGSYTPSSDDHALSGSYTPSSDTHSLTGSRSETNSNSKSSGASGFNNVDIGSIQAQGNTNENTFVNPTVTTVAGTKSVAISAVLITTPAVGGSGGTLRIRRGNGSGTIIASLSVNESSMAVLQHVDTTPGTSNQQYTVTYQKSASATSNIACAGTFTRVDDTHALGGSYTPSSDTHALSGSYTPSSDDHSAVLIGSEGSCQL